MGCPQAFDEHEVLERAMQLFWSRGYHEAALSELLSVMGISQQSLFDTFGDKRGLFIRVIEHYRDTQLRQALALLERAGSPRKNVEAVLGFFAGLASDYRGRGCLVANSLVDVAPRDPGLSRQLGETLGLLEEGLRVALERARAHGEMDPGRDPVAVSRALINAMIGMVVTGKLRPEPAVIRDIHTGTLALLG